MPNIEKRSKNQFELAEKANEVVRLYMQGRPKTKIANELGVSMSFIEKSLADWDDYIAAKAENDPGFLERYLEHIFKFDEEIRMLSDHAWDVVNVADENGAMSTKLQALRLAKDLMEAKARIFQLLSPRMESGYVERIKKVERVNAVLSEIISTTISTCERCSSLAWNRLEEIWKSNPELAGES